MGKPEERATLDYRTAGNPGIDYWTARGPKVGPYTRLAHTAVLLAVGAVGCFAVPFALFYVSSLLHPGNAEASGFAVLIPAILFWFLSLGLGLAGLVVGVLALRRGRPNPWLIVALCVSAIPVAMVGWAILRNTIGGY